MTTRSAWCLGLLISVSAGFEAQAGDLGQLKCSACQYTHEFTRGGSKDQSEKGLADDIFFCRKTKKFMQVLHSEDPKRFAAFVARGGQDQIAKETKILVEKGLTFKVYTEPACPNDLVPVDYYLDNPKAVCPICNKGPIEFESEFILD